MNTDVVDRPVETGSKLLTRACELLDQAMRNGVTLTEISIGAQVTYPWLLRLRSNHADKFPAVDKVERLYEFLSGQSLKV